MKKTKSVFTAFMSSSSNSQSTLSNDMTSNFKTEMFYK